MLILLSILILVGHVTTLDNGVGLTPPMGWNSWNKFGCSINENIVKQTIEQLTKTSLKDKGYLYINLDDCWQVFNVYYQD
jgi:alpha-galactosidase